MVKLQCDTQYKITLPKALIEALGWKKGDRIEIKLEGDTLRCKNESN